MLEPADSEEPAPSEPEFEPADLPPLLFALLEPELDESDFEPAFPFNPGEDEPDEEDSEPEDGESDEPAALPPLLDAPEFEVPLWPSPAAAFEPVEPTPEPDEPCCEPPTIAAPDGR